MSSMDYEMQCVQEFGKKFNQLRPAEPTHLTQRKLKERADFLQEELDEFRKNAATQNMAEMLDALIDLVYVAKGTVIMMGLAEAWDYSWDEVQRANMQRVPGPTKRGNANDVMKPEGWVPPDHDSVLALKNYQPMQFMSNGVVDDAKCLDDEVHNAKPS